MNVSGPYGPLVVWLDLPLRMIFCIFRAVSMPEMIVACEIEQKMTKSITRFIIPLCLALSANGSAVFIACASIFAGNISGSPPSAADVVQIG